MARMKFPKGLQEEFLSEMLETVNFDLRQMSKIAGVHIRTLFDWRREKYQISHKALKRFCKTSKAPIPKNIEILPEHWSIPKAASAGGRTTARRYGGPGTPEGRRKGGVNSQRKFSLDPEYAKKLSFKIRKKINNPKKSPRLAEFIGIMLGDGHIDKSQITVSVNNKVDQEYGYYVSQIIKKLFNIIAPMSVRKNTLVITASSRNLVDYLVSRDMKRGDKIRQQIDVPKWIFANKKFIKECLKGLVDTDGGIYFHHHSVKGIKYSHIGLCFTSHSQPLLKSVEKMLLIFGLNAKHSKRGHVFLYGRKQIAKYLNIIGTSNPKHLTRFKSYKGSRENKILS